MSGASREKQGKFELADKGTILLDEIGEMSPLLQAKLLHRLNVIKLEIPPLRERREDIAQPCNVFLGKYLARYARPPIRLSPELMDAFHSYDWPGNLRQLENIVKRFAVLGDVDLVLADLKLPAARADAAAPGGTVSLKQVSAMAAEQAEKDVVLRLLEERHWNRKQVARELDICYKSLLNKLRRWQLPTRGRSVCSDTGLQ